MKKILLIFSIAFIFSARAFAQQQYVAQLYDGDIAKDFPFGDYDHKALDMPNYDKDPGARALVLKEFGKAWITSNGGRASLNFDYHVKIKLFTAAALKMGHVEIPCYVQDNGAYEEIRASSVQAITYYQEANGTIHTGSVDPDSINIVKVNKHLTKVVFNMPDLQLGCIIEYKYTLESPFLEKFRTWEFQSDIPKLYSEYEVHIPKVFGYNVSLRGALKLSLDTVGIEKYCFEATNLQSDCTVEDYRINAVPAFKQEPYMLSPQSYLSALHFQLTQYEHINNYVTLNQATHLDVAGNWDEVDKTLRYNDNFGSQLNRGSVFKDRIPTITAGKTDELDKAKAIYAYLQKTIKFDGDYSIYSDDGIKKAVDKHTGNVADVNLALVTALNEAGIAADAVILSTRDNGVVNKSYPALSEFNYVITAVSINGKDYLLDATEPLMGFGMLPLRCLNGEGRIIPLKKPSYWINVVTPQKKTDVYIADITLADNGKLSGTVTHYSKGYAGYEQRALIKSFKTTNDYVNSVNLSNGYHVVGSTISNLDDSLDMPLTETYIVEGSLQNGSIDPGIADKLAENPFKSDIRNYDVDFGMPQLNSYTLMLHLPGNKTIDTLGANIHNELPGAGGELSTSLEANRNTVKYTRQYQLNKPVYSTTGYNALKTFFDDIVRSEKTLLKIAK